MKSNANLLLATLAVSALYERCGIAFLRPLTLAECLASEDCGRRADEGIAECDRLAVSVHEFHEILNEIDDSPLPVVETWFPSGAELLSDAAHDALVILLQNCTAPCDHREGSSGERLECWSDLAKDLASALVGQARAIELEDEILGGE